MWSDLDDLFKIQIKFHAPRGAPVRARCSAEEPRGLCAGPCEWNIHAKQHYPRSSRSSSSGSRQCNFKIMRISPWLIRIRVRDSALPHWAGRRRKRKAQIKREAQKLCMGGKPQLQKECDMRKYLVQVPEPKTKNLKPKQV